MNTFTRKQFIRSSVLTAGALLAGPAFAIGKKSPRLSFSTLGCPDWTLQQITDFAVAHGFSGIEVRGLQRQLDLLKCPEFDTAESRQKTTALMKRKGLQFVGLGSSANLHLPEGGERTKALLHARQFIDLAREIRCPYVRVFPNNFPTERSREETINLIVKGLLDLGAYGKDKGVMVLMETHGDVVKINDLSKIMQAATHPNVGLVWDVANMWTVTNEPPVQAYQQLKKYILHTHIKDAKLLDGKLSYTLLGEGDVPIFEGINALSKGGYKGYYSFEWEKLWHPEIAEPQIAFAHYAETMKKHF